MVIHFQPVSWNRRPIQQSASWCTNVDEAMDLLVALHRKEATLYFELSEDSEMIASARIVD